MGPGFRANATIPRAIGLMVRNGFGVRPQELEQATQGLPGRWSICLGENEELSPWEPLSVVGGAEPGADAVSAMLIRTCEYVDNRSTDSADAIPILVAGAANAAMSMVFRPFGWAAWSGRSVQVAWKGADHLAGGVPSGS